MEANIGSGQVRLNLEDGTALQVDMLEFREAVSSFSAQCRQEGKDDFQLLRLVQGYVKDQAGVSLPLAVIDEVIDAIDDLYLEKKVKRNERITALLSSQARSVSVASPSNGTNSSA